MSHATAKAVRVKRSYFGQIYLARKANRPQQENIKFRDIRLISFNRMTKRDILTNWD